MSSISSRQERFTAAVSHDKELAKKPGVFEESTKTDQENMPVKKKSKAEKLYK